MPACRPAAERFEKLWTGEPNTGCWLWLGAVNQQEYGEFYNGIKLESAHRFSYRQAFGEPGKKFVLHRCDIPSCVCPQHLFLGTQNDNMTDMFQKGRSISCGAHGERNPHVKLTEDIVRDIRASAESNSALGKKYDVGRDTIWSIRKRKTWRHITAP